MALDMEERLVSIIFYVAGHTRDKWARDYLLTRLDDFNIDVPQHIRDSSIAKDKNEEGTKSQGGDSTC